MPLEDYDYRDFSGHGDNLVPTLLVPSPEGLIPSDTALADANGDGVPEMAVGRLPIMSGGELLSILDKIVAYESGGGPWKTRSLWLADDPEGGADFPADSSGLAALVPGDYEKQTIYLSTLDPAEARSTLAISRPRPATASRASSRAPTWGTFPTRPEHRSSRP